MYILVIFLMVLSTVQPKYYMVETAEGTKPNFAAEAGKDYSFFCRSYPGSRYPCTYSEVVTEMTDIY